MGSANNGRVPVSFWVFLTCYVLGSGGVFGLAPTLALGDLPWEEGPYLLLLGPPANLVWGARFPLPFLAGTLLVVPMAFAAFSKNQNGSKTLRILALVATWLLFGAVAYSPAI